MSDRSDDPRDVVAMTELQDADQDERKRERWAADRQPAEVRTLDDEADTRPTPGSAEGERDVTHQSESNVPRADDDRH
jgi:hypothetical protein